MTPTPTPAPTPAPSPAPSPFGVLVIDKPVGPTSMQVCANIRARLRRGGAPKRVKVGHGGTLDPLATGVLVILVGKSTKLCDLIMVGEKEYDAEIDLSATSATDDAEGPVTPVPTPVSIPDRAAVEAAVAKFVGTIEQLPPAYSAVHIGGVRAYDLARQGRTETLAQGLKPRPVRIEEIRVVSYAWPKLTIHVRSGKGVYIRSLARDIGTTLGVGGYLTALRRTRVGQFSLDQAVVPASLPHTMAQADLAPPPPPSPPTPPQVP